MLRRLIRRGLTTLWREDPSSSLSDLPEELIGDTLRHFSQTPSPRQVRGVLLDEQRRFGDLLERGRTVLRDWPGRGPLTEEDYRYLHETHGLPREFVPELLPPS